MRIAKLAKIAGAAIVGGVLTLAGVGWLMFDEIKVGGPHYQRIILGKDLLADILPPPEYIVEPFLEATQALNEFDKAGTHADRLLALRRDYDTRHAFWLKQDLPEQLAQTFLTGAHTAAQKFWQTCEAEFVPAIRTGDQAKAHESYQILRAAYEEHRQKIDETISLSTNMVQQVEVAAATRVSHSLLFAGLLTLAVMAGLLAAIYAALHGVVAPISQTAAAMRDLAGGNIDVPFPGHGRSDEIGDMAAAAAVFRDNAISRTALEQEQEELLSQELERRVHLEHVLEDFEARMEAIGKAHLAGARAVQGNGSGNGSNGLEHRPDSGPARPGPAPAVVAGNRKPKR